MAQVFVIALALYLSPAIEPQGIATGAPPSATSQVTFLYVKDIEKAAEFYGRTLALRRTLDLTWVKMFETAPGAIVGLVGDD